MASLSKVFDRAAPSKSPTLQCEYRNLSCPLAVPPPQAITKKKHTHTVAAVQTICEFGTLKLLSSSSVYSENSGKVFWLRDPVLARETDKVRPKFVSATMYLYLTTAIYMRCIPNIVCVFWNFDNDCDIYYM